MLKRASVSIVGGLGMSLGLGLTMMSLISSDFKIEEKLDPLTFLINPKVEEPPVTPKIKRPDDLTPSDPPPPAPRIEHDEAGLPGEPIADPDFELPPMIKTVLDPTDFIIAVSDTDAVPICRIEPNMPPRAERSGHCVMRFDVSPEGQPYNIVATHCSQGLFQRPSIRAVQKWEYAPKRVKGQCVSRSGVVTRLKFDLRDEQGRPIPE